MAEIKWIKITTDIFDDEKILLIESMPDADAIIVIWFKLLVLAGKTNNCGLLTISERMPYTDEMLATIFRRPLNTVRLALEVFEQFGMIETVNDTITIPKWELHQNVEGLEKIREQTRLRVAKHRERQKQLNAPDKDVTLHNVTVTEQKKNKNKNKDKDKDISSSSQKIIIKRGEKKLLNRMSDEEVKHLFETYEDADYLIDAVQEEIDDKRKEVDKPFEFIVGCANNWGWHKNGED